MRGSFLIAVFVAAAACSSAPAAGGDRPRVVSLHDVTTELVVALGATDRLVGVQDPVDLAPEAATAVKAVPRVGELETILAARPTVVLGLGVVAEQSPELVAALRARGIAVELADPATLADVAALVRRVAASVGADAAAADAVVAPIERTAPAAASPTAPPVFVYDCCEPPFTAGGRTVLTDVIARAGGRNVFADVDADWAHVSWEEAAARHPALIVVHDYAWGDQGDVAAKTAAVRKVPGLGDARIVVLPLGWSLGGLGSLRALARLREAIGELR